MPTRGLIGQARATGGRWFQSAPEPGDPQAEQPAPPTVATEARPPRPSLGSLLAEAGVASEAQLKSAIDEGAETGEKLGEIVVRRGWATEEMLAEFLAAQWQLPFSTAAELPLDRSAGKLIPLTAARALGALPIGFDGERVVVAIIEPTENLLTTVAERFDQPAFVVVSRGDFALLLQELSADAEPAHEAGLVEPATSEADAAGDAARSAQTDSSSARTDEPTGSFEQPTSVAAGTLAHSTLTSLEAVTGELQRIHREVAALGKSLELAREQLAEANAELEAAEEGREQDAERIRRLEAERVAQADLFETLRAQASALTETLAARREL